MKKSIYILIISFLCLNNLFSQEDEYQFKTFKYHKASVLSVAFSPDGNYLVSGGDDKQLVIINLKTFEVENKFENNYYTPYCIEITKSNDIFYGSGPDIKLIDFKNNKIALLEGNSTQIWSLDYAPLSNKIVAGSLDYKVRIWDCATQKISMYLEGHKKSVLAVAYSLDEKNIVTGSLDKTVKIWNAENGELIKSIERHSDKIYDIKFHPNGKYFATCSNDRTIKLWDMGSGDVIKTYFGHDFGVLAIAFTPDGNHLLSASLDGTIRLWQLKSGNTVYTFTGHKGVINTVAVNADGTLMASGGVDGKVILWKLDKKIFVEYAFENEFETEKSKSELFLPKQKGETKEDFEIRKKKAKELEEQIIEKYYNEYVEKLNNLTFK